MAEEGLFRPSCNVEIFRDSTYVQLLAVGDKGGVIRNAAIRPVDLRRSASVFRDSAVRWHVRPMSREFGLFRDLNDWKLKEYTTTDEEGHEIVILTHRTIRYSKDIASTEYIREVWLDADRGFSPVRYVDYKGEVLWHEIIWKLAPHETLGWFPESWTIDNFLPKDGESILRQHTEGRVTKIVVRDGALRTWQPLDEKLAKASKEQGITDPFTIAFPEGTEVSDGVAGEKYTMGPRGEKIYTPKSEEIAGLAASRTQNLIFVCALLGMMLLALSVVTWRAWRRMRPAT
jgi:hypothetical protein